MTGLDPDTDSILSIACHVTDAQINLLEPNGWEAQIHHTKEQLERMNQWCIQTHGASGLTAACLASSTTPEHAAEALLNYIKHYVTLPRTGLLAGNSVHADKAFLRKPPFKPVTDYLHYRILDISTIKEAAERWSPKEILMHVPKKKGLHTAREDILESIEEARYYRDTIFRPR